MTDVSIALQCKDYKGRNIVFIQGNYDKHTWKHPELEERSFFPRQVINALRSPTLTVGGHRNNTRCYYFKLFAKDDIVLFAKVVVATNPSNINGEEVYCIKTAHKIDHIQETIYGNKVQYY